MPKSTVGLLLERLRQFRVSSFVVDKGAKGRPDFVSKRSRERSACDDVGTVLKEKTHHLGGPCTEHFCEWNGPDVGTVRYKQLD